MGKTFNAGDEGHEVARVLVEAEYGLRVVIDPSRFVALPYLDYDSSFLDPTLNHWQFRVKWCVGLPGAHDDQHRRKTRDVLGGRHLWGLAAAPGVAPVVFEDQAAAEAVVAAFNAGLEAPFEPLDDRLGALEGVT